MIKETNINVFITKLPQSIFFVLTIMTNEERAFVKYKKCDLLEANWRVGTASMY